MYIEYMNRTQIYLHKTQIIALRKIAQKKELSVSEIIRVLIQEKLEEPALRSVRSSESLIDAAKRISRMWKGGARDLAKNHDKYLYGRK